MFRPYFEKWHIWAHQDYNKTRWISWFKNLRHWFNVGTTTLYRQALDKIKIADDTYVRKEHITWRRRRRKLRYDRRNSFDGSSILFWRSLFSYTCIALNIFSPTFWLLSICSQNVMLMENIPTNFFVFTIT